MRNPKKNIEDVVDDARSPTMPPASPRTLPPASLRTSPRTSARRSRGLSDGGTLTRRNIPVFVASALVLATAGVAIAENTRPPTHQVPPSANGDLVVGLCDGETSVEVKGVKPGQALSRDKAQNVADELMGQWKKKNPGAGTSWDSENTLAQKTVAQNAPKASPPAGGGAAAGTGAASAASAASGGGGPSTVHSVPNKPLQEGHTYGGYTTRDEQIWAASTKAFIDQGDKVFHDAKAVGGTISVSCDMCHPNAANTHPETYPKYQVQLGRVALLRDMINWCIENPARGKPLAEDDPKLKALEAYIIAQRRGTPLEYGKH